MTRPELVAARAKFSAELASMRDRMTREAGAAPRRTGWLLLLVAVAGGLAVGAGRRGFRKNRKLESGKD